MVASETVAFDVIGVEHIRDVDPGEILIINDEIKSYHMPRIKTLLEHIACLNMFTSPVRIVLWMEEMFMM